MAVPTASEATKKWLERTAAATEAYRKGVQSVSVNPMQSAAAAKDRYVAGVQRAAETGKWEGGLMRVNLQQWKDAAAQKGANRIAEGVRQAQGKMESFMQSFLPHVRSGVDSLRPRGGLEENIARMIDMARHNASYRRHGN